MKRVSREVLKEIEKAVKELQELNLTYIQVVDKLGKRFPDIVFTYNDFLMNTLEKKEITGSNKHLLLTYLIVNGELTYIELSKKEVYI